MTARCNSISVLAVALLVISAGIGPSRSLPFVEPSGVFSDPMEVDRAPSSLSYFNVSRSTGIGMSGNCLSKGSTLRQRYSCAIAQWPAAVIDPEVTFIEFEAALPRAMDETDQLWAALGARLFHDPILSVARDISCASCHQPESGWSMRTPVATGHAGRRGRRNPPSLYSAARQRLMGWTGRDITIAQQSLRPLILDDEMGNPNLSSVLRRLQLNELYGAQFAALNGGEPIAATDLGRALATFQQGLDIPTRFDRFLGGNRDALSDQEILGLHLFRTKARCANCHMGPFLTDGRFHNLRISFFGEKSQDLGRYEDTRRPEDAGRFKTPSLRHLSKTAPYMHNGLFETLEGVINLYDRGGGEVWARNSVEATHPIYPFAARLSPHIRPLELTIDEKAALLAFLKSL